MSIKELQARLNSAMLASISMRYIAYAVQFASLMVLARIFSPAAFGTVAIMQVTWTFFAILSEMGIGSALINYDKIPQKLRDSSYTLTFIIGLISAVIVASLGPLIAYYYEEKIYTILCIPLAVGILFNALATVPIACINKELKFHWIASSTVAAELISLAAAIVLYSYVNESLALTTKLLLFSAVKLLVLICLVRYTATGTPNFTLSLKPVVEILSHSSYLLGFSILNFFSRNLDTLLIGKYFGLAPLGIYDRSYQLMRYPLQLITFALAPAVQPIMSQVKPGSLEFEQLHTQLAKKLAMAGIGIAIPIAIFTEELVSIVLGGGWQEIVPLLKVLSVTIPIQMVLSSSGSFYQAAGRTDLMFRCGVFSSITNVTAIVSGIMLASMEAICWCLLISFSVNFLQCYVLLSKHCLYNGFAHFFRQFSSVVLLLLGLIAYIVWGN